ncbi:MAG TPA: hypothetical protein VFB58_11350 [Chloroflexota bacterium]|nr:hypothetical protein [Chloroflexota bacterium]
MRRHTPHFYLALLGLALSLATVGVTIWAYYDERIVSSVIAFALGTITDAVLYLTWFWGIYLLLAGRVPRRLPFLLIHAALGSVIPLLYTISLGVQLPILQSQVVGDLQVNVAMVTVPVIGVQIALARLVFGHRLTAR